MTTWKPEIPFTKQRGVKWPEMAHFEMQRAEALDTKRQRLRRRWLKEKGPYVVRCVQRGMRALNGV